jgi:bifunctional non-homologous end joining protein LigD
MAIGTEDRAGLPRVQPMLATPGPLPPPDRDAQYGYEIKWDGVRAVAYLAKDRFQLFSRNDRDITPAYPELTPPALYTGVRAVFDGEIVAFDESGRPSFGVLQSRMHLRDAQVIARRRELTPVTYIVFDVVYLDGEDLTPLKYRARREVLQTLDFDLSPTWQCPEYRVGGGAELFAATARVGLEGVVAKRLDSRYLPGRRSPAWIKAKHVRTREVVIGGWTPGQGRRRASIGALLLGVPRGEGLEYVGHVGTGFTELELARLADLLRPLAADRDPFVGGVPARYARGANWVRPELVGEVAYAERTRDGRLRAPSWRGLRPDKAVQDVEPVRVR